MKPPPAKIDGARVLEYAWSDTPFGAVRNDDGSVADEIHGLAICRYCSRPDVIYRFSCDSNWEASQDAEYGTVQEAKDRLPTQYQAVPVVWRKYDAAAVERRRATPKDHGFYVTSMPSSRPADYYLGCHGGSVFIDFDRDDDTRIRLVRVSFDGYGCCNLPEDSNPMTSEDSRIFVHQIDVDRIDQAVMARIISSVMRSNQKSLWMDALQEYELI